MKMDGILEVDDSLRAAMAKDPMLDIVHDDGSLKRLKQGKEKFKQLGVQHIAKAITTKLPELYRAAMEGNWKDACSKFCSNQNAKTAKISNIGMTILHVAASCGQSVFVQNLVKELTEEQLEARDQLGRTALHHVALAADVDAAKAMITKNPSLPYLGDVNGLTPLFYAAKWRHPSQSKQMVEYLVITEDENVPILREGIDFCNAFTHDSASDLIVAITASGSYDTALHILKTYPELALKKKTKGMSILHVLAMKPKAFRKGDKLSPLISGIYDLVPVDKEETEHEECSAASCFKYMCKFIKGIREMSEIKQSHVRAVRLVKFVCDELHKKEKEEEEEKKKEEEKEKDKKMDFVPNFSNLEEKIMLEKEQEKEREQEEGKEEEKKRKQEKGKEKEREREEEMDFVQDFFIPENNTAILHLAVENGVFELVDECLKAFPDLIWYADKPPKIEGRLVHRHAQYTSEGVGRLLWNDATQDEHASTSTAKLYRHGTEYADTTSGRWEWHEGQYADTPTRTGRLLLHVAIEHRRVEIFNYLIKLIGKNTKAYADLKLEGNNNSLHLAANLAPTPQLQSVPGPAFQMQRELQWFKAVEDLVYDELKTEKNSNDKTPREVLFDAHKDLLTNAKEWMKDMSNSCMVVATLVATVAFAAMITVPGGNNSNTGVPILAWTKLFVAFSVSNAFSMIFSAISLLMFLSMQTSRYTEDDFLDLLPKVLLRGLISLGVAVATMMISFGTAIGLSLQTRLNWAYIPITVVACFPVIIFTWLQLPLLLQALLFKSGPGIFQRQRDRKSWRLRKIGHRLLLANDRV